MTWLSSGRSQSAELIELARRLKDYRSHHLLQRPRDAPERTGLGFMAFTFFLVATLSGANDVIADKFHISLNAMTWAGRIGLVILPPLAYYLAVRVCLGLQQHDREVLAHGVETGIIRRAPDGRFYEVHQPLGPVDDHGHPIPLEYQGAALPKKMNKLGSGGAPGSGSFLIPDPVEQHEALTEAAHAAEHRALTALRERQGTGNGSNGHH